MFRGIGHEGRRGKDANKISSKLYELMLGKFREGGGGVEK